MKTAKNISLPTVTICKDSAPLYENLCFKNLTLYGIPCPEENTLMNQFRYTRKLHLIPHTLFPNCVILNHFANMTVDKFSYVVAFKHTVYNVDAYVHGPNDLPPYHKFGAHVFSAGMNDNLRVEFSDKQSITRLPSPHPSNCSRGQYNDNILPPPYTEEKCKISCQVQQMIARCGAVPDQFLHYAPKVLNLLPKNSNRTEDSTRECLLNLDIYVDTCGCRVGCSEMMIKSRKTRFPKSSRNGPYLSFLFTAKTMTEITEIAAYPPTKFVTDVGGWLGLFSGMSLLSMLEMILFTTLTLTALYRKFRHFLTARRLNINPSPA